MVPHGYSVIVNAPSVFRFTADACPVCNGDEDRGNDDADHGDDINDEKTGDDMSSSPPSSSSSY